MKKLIVGLTLIFGLDLICIFILNRPIFGIKSNNVYKGLLYDTYICSEYTVPQIKSKWSKFNCTNINILKVKDIKDTTKDINDFACAEDLEQFYEDDDYRYYYNCIKGEYMLVEYEDGYEETIGDALMGKRISINDLDRYKIEYLKYLK